MTTKVVHMVQTTKHKWRLESSQGVLIQDEIIAHNIDAAKRYVTNYISSFQAWDYIIVELEE